MVSRMPGTPPMKLTVEQKLDLLRVYQDVAMGAIVSLVALELDRAGAQKLDAKTRDRSIAYLREMLEKVVEADDAWAESMGITTDGPR